MRKWMNSGTSSVRWIFFSSMTFSSSLERKELRLNSSIPSTLFTKAENRLSSPVINFQRIFPILKRDSVPDSNGSHRWHPSSGCRNESGDSPKKSWEWEHSSSQRCCFPTGFPNWLQYPSFRRIPYSHRAFASLTKTSITIDMAKEVLKNIIRPKEELISIDSIQRSFHFL